MCELMGMCFRQAIGADVTIRAFALRDKENADGWGLAWYHNGSMTLVKEPLSWRQSAYSRFLVSYDHLQSHIFIGHVRHGTVGGTAKHADTHPFSREMLGRQYCFAHNGTVRDALDLPVRRFMPIGETDSEHAFCYLLDAIAERGTHLESVIDWQWLHEQFARFNEMGKFNCLFSDGQRLFCYHDVNGFKGLFMHGAGLGERVDEEPHQLDDEGIEVDLESDAPSRGVIVATHPLTNESWHRFHTGELLVIERGRLAFSNARSRKAKAETPTRRVTVGA